MYPELFRIGSFPINTYGVFLALAFLGGILTATRLAERDGLPRERIYDLCLWVLLASLLGSKILMFFTEAEYREHPAQLLSFDFLRSGGVFYGGLIGAVATGYILIRRYGLPWWKTADACAPGIALGNVLGRQGCFSAGCCWGKPTNLPWGVRFTQLGHEITGVPIGTRLHPTQLYESFAMLFVFFFLLWLHRRKKFSGQVILAYVAIYAGVRFLIEFVRDDPRGDLFGLTTLTGLSTSQMIGLLAGVGALVLLIIRWRRFKAGELKVLAPANSVRG
ncbi:MAG: phosphatidylglycerol---prolipoprotein diacylglyceryl transferase [Blastocatellia bacterium]|jgi:phosphatidylglycerol:prolipoprotein diacylglycerol transferase|nr:phosphatidylglycerol---prolipoprotein diacylglyceryl transferase [Blastocatellia bacterium]